LAHNFCTALRFEKNAAMATNLPKCAAHVAGWHLMIACQIAIVTRLKHVWLHLQPGQRDAATISQLRQQSWVADGSKANLRSVIGHEIVRNEMHWHESCEMCGV
jgi:hypothetical protein